ncbi:hypothetical protein V5799_013534 [Amblyomma americanum]|uniref:Uncharacterized protein n=1 Tax=Amblyomma americanum TaxID=6943 RepID=A0AAQ4E5S4_AMBAM
MVHVNSELIIIVSAVVILFYTSLGGLFSVIYTDLFQMGSTMVGLVYFQRVLSTDSIFSAKMLSYVSCMGCILVAVPSVIVGAQAKTTSTIFSFYGR